MPSRPPLIISVIAGNAVVALFSFPYLLSMPTLTTKPWQAECAICFRASLIKGDLSKHANNLTLSTAPLSGLGSILKAQFDVKADEAQTPLFRVFLHYLQGILAEIPYDRKINPSYPVKTNN